MKKPKTINPKLIDAVRLSLADHAAQAVRNMSDHTGLSWAFCAKMVAHQMQLPGPSRLTYGGTD